MKNRVLLNIFTGLLILIILIAGFTADWRLSQHRDRIEILEKEVNYLFNSIKELQEKNERYE